MIIILVTLLLLVVGIVLLTKNNDSFIGFIFTAITGTALVIALICIPIKHMGVNAFITKFEATETSIISARNKGVDVENAAIQHKIIECNQWLAGKKYYNDSIFGLWIPDTVEDLTPIK